MSNLQEQRGINQSEFFILTAPTLMSSVLSQSIRNSGGLPFLFNSNKNLPDLPNLRKTIDLNNHFIQNPKNTFLIRVSGNSMIGAGINSGDTLIVDNSIEAKNNMIVVASLNNHLIVKRIVISNEGKILRSANSDYEDIIIDKSDDFSVWGVVSSVIKNV